MSYLVLARKYRPRTFREVVGQEVTTDVLSGAIEDDRVGHAYLLCGPRGTGKTTTARIFAKALNCEKGPAPEPCGSCERCRAADDGSDVDLVEIDAASHTSVDNVRDLREQAAYAPMRARFKIYVVDEVHMLSRGAFNALLKTLEEPPPHVKFLFATTELHKVPDTIRSRCQILRLAPIPEARIAERLEEVARLERLSPGPGVLQELARRAHGGLRDALSLLDQLIALGGESPTLEDVARMGGERGVEELDALLLRVEDGDAAGVLTALAHVAGDEDEVASALLEHLRTCLVVSVCGADAPILAGPPDAAVRARAERLAHDRLATWMEELLAARERMRLVPGHERAILEVALLELCRSETSISLADLAERLTALEARLGGAPAPRAGAAPREVLPAASRTPAEPPTEPPTEPEVRPAPRAPSARSTPSAPPAAADSSPREVWDGALAELASSHPGLAELLRLKGKLERLDAGDAVVALQGEDEADLRMLEARRNLAALARALSRAAGRELAVALGRAEAPARRAEDPFARKVADLFGGVVEGER